MVKELNRNHRLVPFLIAASVTYFLSGADLLEKFTPRAVCMRWNAKLIALHITADGAIAINCISLGVLLLFIYKALKKKGLPFTEFVWEFGAFISFIGITHLISVLNMYVTFYWLDGAVKLMTSWFAMLVFLALFRDYHKIKSLPTPKEFADLKLKVDELIKRLEEKNGTD